MRTQLSIATLCFTIVAFAHSAEAQAQYQYNTYPNTYSQGRFRRVSVRPIYPSVRLSGAPSFVFGSDGMFGGAGEISGGPGMTFGDYAGPYLVPEVGYSFAIYGTSLEETTEWTRRYRHLGYAGVRFGGFVEMLWELGIGFEVHAGMIAGGDHEGFLFGVRAGGGLHLSYFLGLMVTYLGYTHFGGFTHGVDIIIYTDIPAAVYNLLRGGPQPPPR